MARATLLQDIGADLRTSIRSLARTPVVALTIVLTVALGIGATTAMIAAVDAALLRPLPYPRPGELVRIYTETPPYRFRFSLVDWLALNEQQTQFASVAAFTDRSMSFSDGRIAERVRGRVVTWTYFDVLGITPVLGRRFVEDDRRPGPVSPVIVSHAFWRERLGGRDDAVGRPLRLDGADYTLIGVLPPRVGPLEYRQDFFVPARWDPPTRKGPFMLTVIGRVHQDANRAAAVDELRAINKRLFPLWKTTYQDERATWNLMDLQTYLIGDSRAIALLALTAVAIVWLIACANASNLMIARVTNRRRELAVRSALGASRVRVMRHLMVESGALAVVSAALGCVVAWLGISVVQSVGAAYLPRTGEIAFDVRVISALVALTVASMLVFGVIPAISGTTGSMDDALRSSRTATGSRGVRRLRHLLVGGQFAIATPLLVMGALLLVSLTSLQRVEIGFDTRNMLTASIQLPPTYGDDGRVNGFWDELKRRIGAVPGVASVAFADGRPPADVDDFNNFDLETQPSGPGRPQPVTPWISVTPEYFGVLGLTLLEGRLIDDRDGRGDNLDYVVVDAAWAHRFFPRSSAVGQRLKGGGCSECPWTTVVGVVTTVKYAGLDRPDGGAVYYPLVGSRFRNIILRTSVAPASLAPMVRAVVHEIDPQLPVSSVFTMDEMVANSLGEPRTLSMLVATLAVIALMLSVIGIYGVMAYYVHQSTREIGIRLALGGTPADVLRLVVSRGMRVVIVGLACGLAAALASTRTISSLLYGVGAADAATFAVVSLVLIAVALAACLVPASRAMRLSPASVLRWE